MDNQQIAEMMYEKGYKQGRADTIDEMEKIMSEWTSFNYKRDDELRKLIRSLEEEDENN